MGLGSRIRTGAIMSRKRSSYRPRLATPPMLINRGLQSNVIETTELLLVTAFANGTATTQHFDSLVDMRNVLTIASAYKADASATAITEAMRIPLANIRERHGKTGRMGVTGEELQLLRAFVSFYADFWLRQSVGLYERACDELGKFNGSLKVAA